MSKSLTTYAAIAKPKTSFTAVAKPAVSYESGADDSILMNDPTITMGSSVYHMSGFDTLTPNQVSTKQPTSFSVAPKNPTTYDPSGAVASWLLNSTVVTLNSIVYLLSGYTGATPNQLNRKPQTSYAS